MKHLPPTLMQHAADYDRTVRYLRVPFGETIDDLLRPEYWAHHVGKLKAGDKIECVADDGSFDVELRVLHVEVGFANMRMLRAWHDEARAAAVAQAKAAELADREGVKDGPKEFPAIDWKKATGWRVLGFDGREVKKGLASKEDAQRELAAYVARAGKAGEKAA